MNEFPNLGRLKNQIDVENILTTGLIQRSSVADALINTWLSVTGNSLVFPDNSLWLAWTWTQIQATTERAAHMVTHLYGAQGTDTATEPTAGTGILLGENSFTIDQQMGSGAGLSDRIGFNKTFLIQGLGQELFAVPLARWDAGNLESVKIRFDAVRLK